MARKLKNVENGKCTLQDLEYDKKTEKTWKIKNTHIRTWNMARKLTNKENEKLTWQDLEYGEKH